MSVDERIGGVQILAEGIPYEVRRSHEITGPGLYLGQRCVPLKTASSVKANKLSLNLSKTNYIIFRSKKKILPVLDSSIKIDNKEITQVTTTKFLGVYVDEHLTFNDHVSIIAKSGQKHRHHFSDSTCTTETYPDELVQHSHSSPIAILYGHQTTTRT